MAHAPAGTEQTPEHRNGHGTAYAAANGTANGTTNGSGPRARGAAAAAIQEGIDVFSSSDRDHDVQLALASIFLDDPAIAVAVCRPDGAIIESNAAFSDRFRCEHDAGPSLNGSFVPRLAGKIATLVETSVGTGETLTLECTICGVRSRCTVAPMNTADGAPQKLVLAIRPALLTESQRPVRPAGHAPADYDDLGPLSCLTTRELDVLRLIGRGMSTAEIAKELHRSVKTIEWHRVSLGNKLKVNNRVELARIAIRAGLAPLDRRDAIIADEPNGN